MDEKKKHIEILRVVFKRDNSLVYVFPLFFYLFSKYFSNEHVKTLEPAKNNVVIILMKGSTISHFYISVVLFYYFTPFRGIFSQTSFLIVK